MPQTRPGAAIHPRGFPGAARANGKAVSPGAARSRFWPYPPRAQLANEAFVAEQGAVADSPAAGSDITRQPASLPLTNRDDARRGRPDTTTPEPIWTVITIYCLPVIARLNWHLCVTRLWRVTGCGRRLPLPRGAVRRGARSWAFGALDVRWPLRCAAHGGSIGVAADIELGTITCPLVSVKDRWVARLLLSGLRIL